ncbi:major facilitator superfamily domain-containing protein [Dipodascopsis uninucleata]
MRHNPTKVHEEHERKNTWQKLLEGVRWYRPGTTPQEKKLLFKLDVSILLFGCLSTFSKTLDNNSLTNAYVTGMTTDLNLKGNELNYLTAVYYSSYLALMIPASFLLTRSPIQRVLPTMEILWGLCTLGCAFVHNIRELYVCRFLLGGTETVAFTGLVYIIGSWYVREEMGIRMALYNIASPLGGMIAGYLMTGTYKGLNGVHGMAGWRWLFIICFAITVPCALVGYVLFPSSPNNTKPSWWLSQAEIDLANRRIELEGVKKFEKKIEWRQLSRVLKAWPWYCFVFAWILFDENQYFGTTPFSLYMKYTDHQYPVSKINNYPTMSKAVTIVTTIIGCYYADKTGDRFLPCLVVTSLTLISAIVLLVYDVSEFGRIFCFSMSGAASSMNPFLMTWASDVVKDDPEFRSLITASMNCIGQCFLAWVPIFTFPTVDAPRFKTGFIFSVITALLHVMLVIFINYLQKRDKKIGKIRTTNEYNYEKNNSKY